MVSNTSTCLVIIFPFIQSICFGREHFYLLASGHSIYLSACLPLELIFRIRLINCCCYYTVPSFLRTDIRVHARSAPSYFTKFLPYVHFIVVCYYPERRVKSDVKGKRHQMTSDCITNNSQGFKKNNLFHFLISEKRKNIRIEHYLRYICRSWYLHHRVPTSSSHLKI